MSSPSWSDVPGDIISQIVQHLPFEGLVRVGVVCKTWRPIVLEAIRHHQFMNMLWRTLHDPSTSTLMRFRPIFSTQQFDQRPQSTADQTTRSLNEIIASDEIKQLASARVCASRFGWLLLFETKKPSSAVMYFYNPFLNVIIDNLPSLPLEVFEYSAMHGSGYVAKATFTAPPTSPDCVIFVVSERRRLRAGNFGDLLRNIINIKTCSLKDGRWSTIHTTELCAHIGDVVYIDFFFFFFYFAAPFLQMVTYNVALQNWTVNNYRYFETSPYFGAFGSPYWPSTYCVVYPYISYCFVESTDGNLLLAIRITGRDDSFNYFSYWQVYRFDLSKYYEWTQIHSLGNQVLLVTHEPLSAMAVRTEGDAMRFANRIVILNGRQCESYTCTDGNWISISCNCNSGQG